MLLETFQRIIALERFYKLKYLKLIFNWINQLKMKKLIIILFIPILLTGCEKEEALTGSVKFIFHLKDNQDYYDIGHVLVYCSGIPDVPLIKNPSISEGVLIIGGLNHGNYYISYNYIYEKAFQVTAGEKNVIDLYYNSK